MKKLLLIALLVVGCDESTEPEDCAGVAGGTAVEDDCGVCDGIDGYVAGSCYDCVGVANGTAVEDDCGVCDGIDGYVAGSCYDCVGVANGTAVEDCLGVCNGDATLAECEALGDMSALQDIINLNNLHPNDAPFYEPIEIGEQTWNNGRLTSLDLSYWSLDTLPNSISNFTALTNLNLKSNNISVLPNTISNLTALASLDLRYNIISTMPSSISYLINLTSLDLYGNDLTALPEEICTIYEALTTLELRSNHICPPYPECITDEDLDYQYQNECESVGCINNTACNYDETALYSYLNDICWHTNAGCVCSDGQNANIDNCGICDTSSSNDCTQDCNGEWGGNNICDCTDQTACNYNQQATVDDGSCIYAWEYRDCNDNCLNDVNNNGICDEAEGTGVTDIDGNEYETVIIGEQEWMRENLKTTTYSNGNDLSSMQYRGSDALFGYSYRVDVVTHSWGICPAGWHIPTNDEVEELVAFLGGASVAGGKMKSTGTYESGNGEWYEPNTGATNISGFTAQPQGYFYMTNQWGIYKWGWDNQRKSASFYYISSDNDVRYKYLYYYDDDIEDYDISPWTYASTHPQPIRCIKD